MIWQSKINHISSNQPYQARPFQSFARPGGGGGGGGGGGLRGPDAKNQG